MASYPMPNPQASAPQPSGDAGAGAQQMNPLTQMLAQAAMTLKQVASQNTVVQPELMQAVSAIVQAIQKVQQASPSAPQSAPAPTQQ